MQDTILRENELPPMIIHFSKSAARLLSIIALISLPLQAAENVAGAAALVEKNCIACHSPSEHQAEWLPSHLAPKLWDIGSRVSVDWLQNYLAAPHQTMPGTVMPDLLHGNREQAEALSHYLISLGKPNFRRVVPDRAAVARGESLYQRIGCVACHAPQNEIGRAHV